MTKKRDEHRATPDRKTRVEGDRVIHTPAGKPYDHDYTSSRARGLTVEQWDDQRDGTKIDEGQVREAAAGERSVTGTGSRKRTKKD